MTLRGTGGKLISSGGKLVRGDSDCCCCKCCWCFSGDEKMVNDLPSGHFLEIGPWVVTITDSTLLRGDAAENFCGVKFLLDLTITDQSEELPPCDTTGTAELICDCTLCEDIFWEFNFNDCGGYTLPDPLWMGDDCKIANCDNPTCANCSGFTDLNAGGAKVTDPDGSVHCRCPGDTCSGSEEWAGENWNSYSAGQLVSGLAGWTTGSNSPFVNERVSDSEKRAGGFLAESDPATCWMERSFAEEGVVGYEWMADTVLEFVYVYLNGVLQKTHTNGGSEVFTADSISVLPGDTVRWAFETDEEDAAVDNLTFTAEGEI